MKARATLAQLLKQWGSPRDIDPKHPPELVRVEIMSDAPHWWRRVGPLNQGETLYERREDSDA